MKRLVLLRHAKTEPWFEGTDDFSRALTPGGRIDANLIAKALAEAGWRPRTALVSTARRARETWREAAAALPEAVARFEDDLYLADPDMIEAVLRAAPDTDAMLVIAHNPGLHDFAVSLMKAGGAPEPFAAEALTAKLPTGGAAMFEALDDAPFHPSGFRLAAFLRPRDLREG